VPTIDTLRPDQLEDSTAVLARAFDDDPVFRYLYPAPRRRQWSTGSFLQAIVRDVRDRLRIEHELRTSARRFEELYRLAVVLGDDPRALADRKQAGPDERQAVTSGLA